MRKSYTGHETCYRDLRRSNCSSWDQYRKQAPDFDHFCMRSFVEAALSMTSVSPQSAKALEIGCGTGPLSCFLAARGFQVEGIDISPTAIAVARDECRARDLAIEYRVADVCRDPLGVERYDLIVDGHCLHCLADPQDRMRAFSNIFHALVPNGEFWVDSMIATETTTFGDLHRLDAEGVLWTRIGEESDFSDAALLDGAWHLPTRRLHRNSKAFASELEQAGFSIRWSQDVPPERDGEPAGFQAICTKTKGAEPARAGDA
jgi:SAM-dependent methyltransferase